MWCIWIFVLFCLLMVGVVVSCLFVCVVWKVCWDLFVNLFWFCSVMFEVYFFFVVVVGLGDFFVICLMW